MAKYLLLIYSALNLISFALFGIDKYKALKDKWRIPEKTLMLSAALGVFGAAAGMLVFRHKIRKPLFYVGIPLILAAETAAAVMVMQK